MKFIALTIRISLIVMSILMFNLTSSAFLLPIKASTMLDVKDDSTAIKKIAHIQGLHKQIFLLPFEREYITGTIMDEIKHKRAEVSPHFPDRAQTGDDADKVNAAFESWVETYPDEYTSYVDEVSIILRKYGKSTR